MGSAKSTGILLINTGTTAAPRTAETRAYLREFLSDSRVVDIPAPLRWLLRNLVILPFRSKRSAEAYSKIWTRDGSPLLCHTHALAEKLREKMPDAAIEIGMRYGFPSIARAMELLLTKNVTRIIVAPMFPQYTSAATGSALEKAYAFAARRVNVPALSALPSFWDAPGFVRAWKAVALPHLEEFRPDHVLFSYHGLPERHVRACDPSGAHCLTSEDCCNNPGDHIRHCYRAQCLATTRALVEALNLKHDAHSVGFQSRLGRDKWLSPATDQIVPALANRGVKRLAVICPAFTVDCLETLEEIGMRARDRFLRAGGEEFRLVPSLNAHPAWVEELAAMLGRL
ncbi:MAG TPA: ferrochelatase [Candidatus Hydrogenedentes bacterium]|nr:ferrochelatase [Candidatus Hydrogenedentota bacterium]HOS03584.1 ferrochelatase [Candidatus Hydrogenedentota bacterium]